jgi:phosphoribosylamine---glycine ligase
MRVLVVGGGGREHAIAAKLRRSPLVDDLFAAPGNAGIAEVAVCEPIAAGDVPGLVEFAERERIDLTVVGPEAPLVAGLVDELASRGLKAFGPTRSGARIEGSKAWTKELCRRAGIATPASEMFTDYNAARAFLDTLVPPYVIKVDGLAAGKGVTVTDDIVDARAAVEASLVDRVFGEAGARVLVEEFAVGDEVSMLGVTDGIRVLPLPPAQDFKRAEEDDLGPNTGGMGAYSPVPFVDEELRQQVVTEILEPAVAAMTEDGIDYRGVLYAGLMLTDEGPTLLEFNARFGDPETEAILPRLESDLAELLLASAEGDLRGREPRWGTDACVTVVLASAGYPGHYGTGLPIEGLESAAAREGVQVFHSGTAMKDGRVVTSGGRVLAVSARGQDLGQARSRAYGAVDSIFFEGMRYRGDIAARAAEESVQTSG